ncbi:MAG: nuclear transport factor 2 family protein [Synechococcales cyanobacterium CRU_2_2]|nr:nuclear transport factor 2 family protein [Synechococcales cyanobacterium CRU_2_2]
MSQRALFSTVTRWAMLGALGIGLGLCTPAGAKGTAMAPPKVAQLVEQMDTAASARDLTRLLATYSPNFVHGDGLDRKAFSRSLEQFWNQYPNLTYKTEVVAWTENRQGGVAETLTRISGTRQEKGREFALEATLRSRQHFEGDRLVRQETLSEESTVKTGARPPKLAVNLPQTVKTGETFSLDVIVLEPIENDLLLGGVKDEAISTASYPLPSKVAVEPLIDAKSGTGPGGIFKLGKAPDRPESRWISAVVVRKDGITMVTRRLQVVAK